MSSRSLATARARRSGETAPPVSGTRPGTSIGSHAAFVPQQQQQQQQYQQQPNNVRTGRPQNQQYQQQNQAQNQQQNQQQQQQYQQQPNNVRTGRPQNQQYQQQNQSQNQQQGGKQVTTQLPFSKLSIAHAIGLITMRIGRIEQWVIDNEGDENNNNNNTSLNLPENSKIIDISIFNNIINRLDSIEKKEQGTEGFDKLSESVSKLTEQITRIGDEGIKQSLLIAKNTEQVFKFDRDLIETKDMIKSFMIKYDMFVSETNNKFEDYENALSEIEKNCQHTKESIDSVEENYIHDTNSITDIDIDIDVDVDDDLKNIMSSDLKNIITQELASSSI
jgi:hypothetical protein